MVEKEAAGRYNGKRTVAYKKRWNISRKLNAEITLSNILDVQELGD